MKKLEKLKIERRIADCFTALPQQSKLMLDRLFQREIELIENYGKQDEPVDTESISQIKKILELSAEDVKDGD